jgi:putative redox protein
MTGLLLSLAACMAVDVRMILEKGRVPLEELVVEIEGDRLPEPPRRFTRLRLTIRLRGPGEEHEARIARAVALSRDKYCSVFHSLRTDLDVEIATERL